MSILADNSRINAYNYIEGEFFSIFKIENVKVSTSDTICTFTITPCISVSGVGKVATGDVYVVKYNSAGEYIGCEKVS